MTADRNNLLFTLLAASVALLAGVAGYSLWKLSHEEGETRSSETLLVLPEPRVLGDFQLLDQDGADFTLERLRGEWSLLFFGFTYCPDICPSTLYDLQQVRQTLLGEGVPAEGLQVVFVSVDPERDSPARLKEYVSYFDPDFLGVTGDPAQLKPLALRLGVAFRIEDHEQGAENYSVDHSASVFLTDPQGRLYGVFPAPHDAAAMARDVAAVID